jgi:hypothetical protein
VLLSAAREAAAAWIAEHAAPSPGFRGAYTIGSTVALSDDAELPPASDLDVAVVLDGDDGTLRRGKLHHRGALLEISVFPWERYRPFDAVAASYHLAAGLATGAVIADRTGELRALQREVARSFWREDRVRERCRDAARKVIGFLAPADEGDVPGAPADRATGCVFAAGVTTHVLLVAALENPTVRLRYVAAARVLAEYGMAERYGPLLALLGCAHMTPDRVVRHVEALARAFDAAARFARTRFPFSSDVTPLARPIAIDGSRDLVRSGRHREAVFWIAATFARCHRILSADAPPAVARDHAPAFAALLADLGIGCDAELASRATEVRQALPEILRTADAILAANPRVERAA